MGNASRRRRMEQVGTHTGQVARGSGVRVKLPAAPNLIEQTIARSLAENRHMWVLTGLWHLDDPLVLFSQPEPAVEPSQLLSVAPPGCYLCEAAYTAASAGTPCPGMTH